MTNKTNPQLQLLSRYDTVNMPIWLEIVSFIFPNWAAKYNRNRIHNRVTKYNKFVEYTNNYAKKHDK